MKSFRLERSNGSGCIVALLLVITLLLLVLTAPALLFGGCACCIAIPIVGALNEADVGGPLGGVSPTSMASPSADSTMSHHDVDEASRTPPETELTARVNVTEGAVSIQNLNSFDWQNILVIGKYGDSGNTLIRIKKLDSGAVEPIPRSRFKPELRSVVIIADTPIGLKKNTFVLP